MQTPVFIAALLGYTGGTGVGAQILRGLSQSNWFDPNNWIYTIGAAVYLLLIIGFAYFYTSITFNPLEIADNMKKQGGFIPGIRPGTETKEYVNKVLCRITVLGAIGLAFIAVLPHALPLIPGINLPQSMGIGGTGIIIVVGVAMETVKQIEGRLTQKSYSSFLQR